MQIVTAIVLWLLSGACAYILCIHSERSHKGHGPADYLSSMWPSLAFRGDYLPRSPKPEVLQLADENSYSNPHQEC